MDMAHLADEVRAEFFSADRGFARTVWLMLTRPGRTLAEIWRGEQPTLTRPLRYFLIVFSIYALAVVATGAIDVLAADLDRTLLELINARPRPAGVVPLTIEQVHAANPLSYYSAAPLVFELFNVTMLFLASWIAFARWGINAAERLSMTLYFYGTFNLVQVPFVFVFFTDWRMAFFQSLSALFLVYLVWAVSTLRETSRWRSAGRAIAWFVTLQVLALLLWAAFGARLGWQMAQQMDAARAAAAPATVVAPPPR